MTTVDDLQAARDLLAESGWRTGQLRGPDGSHCAVGAVLDVVGDTHITGWSGYGRASDRSAAAIHALHDELDPTWHAYGSSSGAWPKFNQVAGFNNASTKEKVLALFDKAIAKLRKREVKPVEWPEIKVEYRPVSDAEVEGDRVLTGAV